MRLALLLLLLLLQNAAIANTISHSVGIARDAKTADVRYIEHHQYMPDGLHLVDYYTPSLERFAYKKLRYPALPQHPEIEQEDFNRGSYTSVTVTRDEIVMLRRTDSEEDTGVLLADEDLIVDAGFDAYIKANWSSLLENDETDLRFAVAGLARSLTMRVVNVPTDSDDHVAFRIYPRNWFVRMFIPSLDLRYTDNRQLLRYDGYSNLLPNEGESKQVVIDFEHYETDAALNAPMQVWLTLVE